MRFSAQSIQARLVRLRLPVTSRRLLLITLLTLVGVMAGMIIYTSRQLEVLSATAVDYSATSLAVAGDVSTLHELTIDMERSARQFYILMDERLVNDFNKSLDAGKQITGRLGKSLMPQSAQLTERWISLGENVAAQLNKNSPSSMRQQQRVFAQFSVLSRSIAAQRRNKEQIVQLEAKLGAKLAEAQRRNEQLSAKIQALKALEKDLLSRPEPKAEPAVTPPAPR